MSVYVDEIVDYGPAALEKGLPASEWAHLTADTRAELHAFARRLGLVARWFQDDPIGWHYDVTTGKRYQAIRAGAEAIDWRAMGELMTRRRAESGNLAEVDVTAARTAETAIHGAADWLAALARTGGQCECVLNVKGHQHRAHEAQRCPVRREHGGRLYMTRDGALYCSPCFNKVKSVAAAAAPVEVAEDPATLTLF